MWKIKIKNAFVEIILKNSPELTFLNSDLRCYSASHKKRLANDYCFFQGVGVAVLRGAVLYGLDPSVVYVRRAMKTYGIGIIKPFLQGEHPEGEKGAYMTAQS